MNKIYVPNYDDFSCIIVKDKDTIRAYKNQPDYNSSSDYTDFYINSHYLQQDGIENITSEITCINISNLTDNIYYRNDLLDITLVSFLFILIILGLPYKLLKTFKKSLK